MLIGAVAAWPLGARGQQSEPMRRIGVLMLYPENDLEGQRRATAFREGLQKLGWVVGRNVQIDFQWGLPSPGPSIARRRVGALIRTAPRADLTWLQRPDCLGGHVGLEVRRETGKE
jgi:hypothetical protein